MRAEGDAAWEDDLTHYAGFLDRAGSPNAYTAPSIPKAYKG